MYLFPLFLYIYTDYVYIVYTAASLPHTHTPHTHFILQMSLLALSSDHEARFAAAVTSERQSEILYSRRVVYTYDAIVTEPPPKDVSRTCAQNTLHAI